MCGEKQNLLKVFARGIGKYCRVIAQKLNEVYRNQDEEPVETSSIPEQPNINITMPKVTTKWSQFIDKDVNSSKLEETESVVIQSSTPSIFNKTNRKQDETENSTIQNETLLIFDDKGENLDALLDF